MTEPLCVGDRIGRLQLLEKEAGPGRSKWICTCICGQQVTVIENNLKRGKTSSCGCLKREKLSKRRKTHGESGPEETPEYRVWNAMLRRCRNPNVKGYQRYGGRGITVCKRWLKFENFLEDMGRRPSKNHTLDREDTNKNYTPDNCRWATRSQQARNRRDNHLVTINGVTKTLSEWYETREVDTLVLNRLRRGWSAREAMSTPRGKPRTRKRRRGRTTVLE